MISVRFIYPYGPIQQQFKEEGVHEWGGYKFYFEDELKEYDFLLIYDTLPNDQILNTIAATSILVVTEPPSIKIYQNKFLNQFDYVLTYRGDIKHKRKINSHVGYAWKINKSYKYLQSVSNLEKKKDLALISSSKGFSRFHKNRLVFSYRCMKEFSEKIDFYGRGINTFESKWDVLADYYFSLCIENQQIDNYFTEKLLDSFLTLTVPIYFGSSNIFKFFPEESIIKIDINSFSESRQIIQHVLENIESIYNEKKDALIEARNRVLNFYQFFPVICEVLNSLDQTEPKAKKSIINIPDSVQIKATRRLKKLYYGYQSQILCKKIEELI